MVLQPATVVIHGKAQNTWVKLNPKLTSPETGLATLALMLRRARKYRGVTVSKAAAPL
jgi:hypothetical protein